MNKTLRIALCGVQEEPEHSELIAVDKPVAEGEGRTITMTGPLAEIYTKALAVMYAKPDPTTLITSLESQANDALVTMAAARASLGGAKGGAATNTKAIQANIVSNAATGMNIAAFAAGVKNLTPEVVISATHVLPVKENTRTFFIVDLDGFPMTPPLTDGLKLADPRFDNTITGATSKFITAMESLGRWEVVFGLEGLIEALKK